MGLLQTLMTDGAGPGGTDVPRWKQLLASSREDPRGILRMLNPSRWSERTVIALVMQHLDNSITTFTRRGKLGFRRMTSKQGHGEPNPTWIPAGNEVTRRIAEKIDGVAGGTWGELFNIPLTAHFLGGAAIGDSRRTRGHRPVSAGLQLPDTLGARRRRRSRRISVSTRRFRSPRRPSALRRCGPTKARWISVPRRARPISDSRPSRRNTRSSPSTRPPGCGTCRSSRSARLAKRV